MNLTTCRYCGSPVAWTPRSTGGTDVALDLDPVPVDQAHPDAPLFALRRDRTAQPVRDIHRPPALVYVAHRCPQYGDAQAVLDACRTITDDVQAWMESMPPTVARPRRLRVVS